MTPVQCCVHKAAWPGFSCSSVAWLLSHAHGQCLPWMPLVLHSSIMLMAYCYRFGTLCLALIPGKGNGGTTSGAVMLSQTINADKKRACAVTAASCSSVARSIGHPACDWSCTGASNAGTCLQGPLQEAGSCTADIDATVRRHAAWKDGTRRGTAANGSEVYTPQIGERRRIRCTRFSLREGTADRRLRPPPAGAYKLAAVRRRW